MSAAALEARRRAVAAALRADALQARVDRMSRRLVDMHSRLAAVENMLLEASWDTPALAPEASTEPTQPDDRVGVPKLELGQGGFSSAASQALFGP